MCPMKNNDVTVTKDIRDTRSPDRYPEGSGAPSTIAFRTDESLETLWTTLSRISIRGEYDRDEERYDSGRNGKRVLNESHLDVYSDHV